MPARIQPFDSGIVKGVNIYFLSLPGQPDHVPTVEIDLTQAYLKGWLKRIGSIRLFNQYSTLRVTDTETGIDYYSGGSTFALLPCSTMTKRFRVTRYDTLASNSSFELVIYEDVQPAIVYGVGLP